MESPVTFDRPLLLFLWPALAFWFCYVARRSSAGLEPSTLRLALILRCTLCLVLVFMLAGMHLVSRTNRLTTIFVLDFSHSIRPDERAAAFKYIDTACDSKPGSDNAGIVVFGRSAVLASPVSSDSPDLNSIDTDVDGDATNLRGALQLAAASMPADTGRKIVVLSDGNENIGSAADEIEALHDSGVQVDIAPTALNTKSASGASPEAMVDDVRLPEHGNVDTPFTVGVVVSSNIDQRGRLTLLRDGVPIVRQTVSLPAGKKLYSFDDKIGQTGFHRYDAVLEPSQDTMAENNKGYGYISVRGRPRVLYVSDDPTATSLTDALKAQGIDVHPITPEAMPDSVAALASYDSIILSDVPADEFTVQQMKAIEESVREFGVGLGMVGGPDSYAAGGYATTPVEDALPVNMDVRDLTRNPPIAIALVIEDLEEPGTVNESIEAAKSTVDLLMPQDEIGVMDCNDTWRIPLQHVNAQNKQSIKNQMDDLNFMNDPYSYDQYVQDAASGLLQTKEPIKHLIFLGDGDAQPPDPTMLAGIKKEGITVSTIATGADPTGVQELSDMAQEGGGRSYVVEKDADLPTTLLRDQQTYSRILFVEKPLYAKANAGSELISGIDWTSAPPLLGYNLVEAKENADVALTSPDHSDPLLVSWRYGLGRTFAFTSDDQPHWAVHWLSWSGYPRLWSQTVRWSLRSTSQPKFSATVDGSEGRGSLVVDAYSAKGWAAGQKITAHVVAPDLNDSTVTLTQTAPGRFEGRFDADQTGSYMVSVQDGSGPAATSDTLGMVVPYSPEYRTLQTNLPLLSELADQTGGKIQDDPAMIFRDAPLWVAAVTDPGRTLLLLSALLFLADIAARRLAIRPKALQYSAGVKLGQARQAIAKLTPAPITSVATAATQARVLARQVTAREVPEPQEALRSPTDYLARRATGAPVDENPFPQVARMRGPGPADLSEHSDRLKEAQRNLRNRIDPD